MPFGAFRLNGLSRYVAAIIAGRTAKTVTAYNQAQIDTAQSKFGGASALFDGNDDYLIASSIANESSGALTFEAWVRFDILPSSQTLGGGSYMMLASMSSNSYILIQNTKVQIAVANSYYGFTIPTIAINTWYHVAIVREADNDFFVYWNGTKITGTVDGGDTDVNKGGNWWGTGITIGRFIDSRGSWDGHIDELRISNTARYTANFTPSTTPFINDANTLMLLHMDGTDASTTFIDDNGTGRSAAGISATGNAQVDTAQSKFGGASALFDGTGDRLIVDNKSEFNFGSNNFTIEFWVRANNFTGLPGVLSMATVGSSDGWNLQFGTDGRLYIEYGFAGSVPNTRANTTALTANVWSHVAFVRNGSTVTAYKDGVAGTSHTISTSSINSSTADLVIGDGYGLATTWAATADFNGHIDELRISDTARYTANFTPSTTAFVNDANTLLLMHMNGTDGSTTFTDDNS